MMAASVPAEGPAAADSDRNQNGIPDEESVVD